MWPLVLQRARAAGDDGAVETLAEMEAEHSGIDPTLAACTGDLDRLAVAADEDARSAFEVRIVAIRESMDPGISRTRKARPWHSCSNI